MMKALRRYLAGSVDEPPKLGAAAGAEAALGAGASSSPGSSALEKSHSTAASTLPDCEAKVRRAVSPLAAADDARARV